MRKNFFKNGMTSPIKKIRGCFTDRGLGDGLVLSAGSSRQVAENVKAHIVHPGSPLCMKEEMFVISAFNHLTVQIKYNYGILFNKQAKKSCKKA